MKKYITIEFAGKPLRMTMEQANLLAIYSYEARDVYECHGTYALAKRAQQTIDDINNNTDYSKWMGDLLAE